MTWTAGELVNQLRALDPQCEVLLLTEEYDGRQFAYRLGRAPWARRLQRRLTHRIVRVRVIRPTETCPFAFIQGEQL